MNIFTGIQIAEAQHEYHISWSHESSAQPIYVRNAIQLKLFPLSAFVAQQEQS